MKTLRFRTQFGDFDRRGAALVFALILSVAVASMSMALLAMNLGNGRVRVQAQGLQRSFYVAEAGLSDALAQLNSELLDLPADGDTFWVGTEDAPIALGSSEYWVAIKELGPRAYSLAATGNDGRDQTRLELVLSEVPDSLFQYAAFGAEGVVLDSNAFIDSYDSAYGSYDSQVEGGNDYALEGGNVGSNGDILLKANTEVHGDVTPGPGHVVDDSAPNVFISGSTDDAEEEFEMPTIDVPPIPSSGVIAGNADVTLGPGLIHYDSVVMQGGTTLTIRGPATFVVDQFKMKSNSNLIFDGSGGPIVVYGTGDFLLESNSNVRTLSESALDVTLMLSGDNIDGTPPDQLKLSANSEFIGAIYAPNSKFSLGSNFNIFGSIICGDLDLSSFGEIHFDEALRYDGFGASGTLYTALWRRLPKQ